MNHTLRAAAAALFVALVLASCGYRFAGEGQGPKPGLRTIGIPVFENKTSEPGLESTFGAALRREFMIRSDLRVVPEGEAEAVFRGKVVQLYTADVAHKKSVQTNQIATTVETRLYATLDIRCVDAKTNKILWQDNRFTYYESYVQNPDPNIAFQNRQAALDILAREMAVRIRDRFLADF